MGKTAPADFCLSLESRVHNFPSNRSLMRLRSAALTDIGRVRRQNEDRYFCDDDLRAYGVADGVGGLPGGADAAQLAVDEVVAALRGQRSVKPDDLIAAAYAANTRVAALGQTLSPTIGIGTTLTFGVFTARQLLLAHVGDSRCYLLRDDQLELLTEDHSVENEARHRRARGEHVEVHEHFRNALTRCIGQPTRPEVDTLALEVRRGDCVLFATDGITRMVSTLEIAQLLSERRSLDERLAELIKRANTRGGPDNATAVLIEVEEIA